MPSITNAYQWAIRACNAPNVGYSQNYRNQQTINGITYYDCSSFIYYALIAGGFPLDPKAWPFVTWTMGGVMLGMGFVKVPVMGAHLPGDILVANNGYWQHTEMIYQGLRTMGAHGSSRPLPDQVSINDYDTPLDRWDECYRFGSGGATEYQWIRGGTSEYFDREKQVNNAHCLAGFFLSKGWTIQAIAGLCGNVEQESKFNPDLIEIGGTGHGLVQWTPPTDLYKVLQALYGSADDWGNPDKQCNALYAEYQQSTGEKDWGIEGQWYATGAYPMSWKQWATSTDDPGMLAMAFQYNYERPADYHPERAEFARQWYNVIKYDSPFDPSHPGYKKKKMPLWMYLL